jgi:hypothetical protein
VTGDRPAWWHRGTRALARLALPIGVGLAVLTACLVVSLSPRDAAAAAVTAFGVTLSLRMLDKGQEHAWPAATDRDTDGSRRDVSHLTWSLVGRDGAVSEAAVRRLRQDAVRRLARVGVVLPAGLPRSGDHPGGTTGTTATGAGAVAPQDASGLAAPPGAVDRARALLGEPAWRVLTGPGGWLPDLDDVERCVDALERLVPAGEGPRAAEHRTPTPPTAPPRTAPPSTATRAGTDGRTTT